MEFYGSPQYPRSTGQVIRLCLSLGVEPVFIPVREPWRNGKVEKFNDHWTDKFFSRVQMDSEKALKGESLEFETRHNHTWRYSPLKGKTPLVFLRESRTKLNFPMGSRPRRFEEPTKGKYHVIRFIRSDLRLDIFGEKFPVPADLKYEYVRATIDIKKGTLQLYRDDVKAAEIPYKRR